MVHHLPTRRLRHGGDLACRSLVDVLEQDGKGIAEAETAPAAMADVEDALDFAIERGLVPELRILPVERVSGRRLEAPFAGRRIRALAHARRFPKADRLS